MQGTQMGRKRPWGEPASGHGQAEKGASERKIKHREPLSATTVRFSPPRGKNFKNATSGC